MENYYRKERILLEIFEGIGNDEHFHQDIELLYVIDGDIEIRFERQTCLMHKDDIFLINANTRHAVKPHDNALYARISIAYEMVSDILGKMNVIFICDSTVDDDSNFEGLRKIIKKLIRSYLVGKGKGVSFSFIALCYNLVNELAENFLIETNGLPDSESDKNQERINLIDNYICTNFRSAISLKDLSEQMFLSNGYLSRFFKSNYGMSFQEYLTKVRLNYALDELLYTDFPITRIVYDNGFANVALFNKAFKKEYGETPSQMRKRVVGTKENKNHQLSEKTEERLESLLWGVGEAEESFSGVIEVKASVAEHEPYKPTWNKLINIGTAAELSRSEVQEHVLLLHEALKFEYVRFWTPFSKELLIDINSREHNYNFSRLDAVLDYLLKIEVKPFIELAEKPKRLTTTTRKYLAHEKYESPDSIENWEAIMDAFLLHIINRYGRDEVSKWRFEFWFEMDDIYDDQKIEEFAEKFDIAYKIIHKYTNALLGGCGMHTFANKRTTKEERIISFYKKVAERSIHPDFITAYIYAYDTQMLDGRLISMPSSDKDFVEHSIANIKKAIGPDMSDSCIFLTEWNMTVSERNIINDTCFKAAYIIRNYINTLGKIDCLGYFSGTDRISEFYDTVDFLFGGTGLLSKDGVMKPAAFAIDFLNRLYPELVSKGENYLISSDGYGAYGIVCHNFKPLSYNYYHADEDSLERDKLQMYLEDTETVKMSICLEDVDSGEFQAKIYSINEENGSVMSIWRDLGYENNLTREDIKYFRRNCEPRLSIKKVMSVNGTLKFEISMQPNEIVFINLVKNVKG